MSGVKNLFAEIYTDRTIIAYSKYVLWRRLFIKIWGAENAKNGKSTIFGKFEGLYFLTEGNANSKKKILDRKQQRIEWVSIVRFA